QAKDFGRECRTPLLHRHPGQAGETTQRPDRQAPAATRPDPPGLGRASVTIRRSAFRLVPLGRRTGCRLDSRDEIAIQLLDERGQVVDKLLPSVRAADRVLAAANGALGYGKREE